MDSYKLQLLGKVAAWHHDQILGKVTWKRAKTMSSDLMDLVVGPLLTNRPVQVNLRLSLYQRLKATDHLLLQELKTLAAEAKHD